MCSIKFISIQGDNDKLLEYISKTGDILISYYTNGQNKETLTHQHLMLTGNCNEKNIIWCSCRNEKKQQLYFNQKDAMFVKMW